MEEDAKENSYSHCDYNNSRFLLFFEKVFVTHVDPKQVVGEDEKVMELHNQCVYNPQPSASVYSGQKHLHQLLFLQRNKISTEQCVDLLL